MCLICHDSAATTGGVPGFIVRSVFADRYGYPLSVPGMDESVTTDQTPIEQRWGGWYVTGTHAQMQHRGNLVAPKLASELPNVKAYIDGVKLGANSNVTDLHDRFDVKRYLAPDSDIVALLVLTHQSSVHNLITAAGYQARIEGDESPRAKDAAERLVRALLFANEAPLAGPIEGTVRVRRRIFRAWSSRSERPFAPRSRSENASVPISAQLPGLLRRIRRAAGGCEGRGLYASTGGTDR